MAKDTKKETAAAEQPPATETETAAPPQKETTGDRTVQMLYPRNANGPAAMVLHGVGYFEKGVLLGQRVDANGKVTGTTVPADVAAGLVKRKKGPRIATEADIKSIEDAIAKPE